MSDSAKEMALRFHKECEELRSENARLKQALQSIANYTPAMGGDALLLRQYAQDALRKVYREGMG